MSDNEPLEELTVPEPPDGAVSTDGGSRRRTVRRLSIAGVAIGLGVVGTFAYQQIKPVVDAQRYATVTYEVPEAPRLTPAAGETLLRIDPSASSLTYEVDEKLGGQTTGTAKGSTSGIVGDIALNEAALEDSRIGQIVVNIEQFESDNNLRDARIRQDFLQSHQYPLATFDLEELTGLSGKVEEGRTYEFTIDGFVTVKNEPATVTWDATATWEDGKLVATATTVAKLCRPRTTCASPSSSRRSTPPPPRSPPAWSAPPGPRPPATTCPPTHRRSSPSSSSTAPRATTRASSAPTRSPSTTRAT